MNQRYRQSGRLLEHALELIPTGTQTFSKSSLLFPRGNSPAFLREGRGGRVTDVDGNEYVDLMAALLAVMLGYRDPDVDGAIRAQLDRGISFSLATELEPALAERLVERIPCAEMVRFAKNGTDATSAAIRVARAVTGRDHVISVGYHGWQDWYVGATTRDKGVPGAVSALTHAVAFNDTDALQQALETHSGEVAAIILEPVQPAAEPEAGYLEAVRRLTDRAGAVLVFDEIIAGCRLHRGGAQAHYGVTPDLACLGKALGNGMPLSALVGRRELMREYEHVFVSGTFGGEALSLAAAIAVLDKIDREPVVETLWQTGQALGDGMRERIAAHQLDDAITVRGPAPFQALRFDDHPHAGRAAIHTLYAVTMLEHGVLSIGSINPMYAHDDADVAAVLDAFDKACDRIAGELTSPGLADRLGCPLIKPVFAVRTT